MRLGVPKGKGTRPMTDRVRESLFSSLGSEYGTPGELPGLYVMDMFAGTGSLGLEALSRGAKLSCFVEKLRPACNVLRENIATVGLQDRCWIVAGDAFVCNLPPAPAGDGWELVFVDPPYAAAGVHIVLYTVPNLLGRLSESHLLADRAIVVLRHPLDVDYERQVTRLGPYRRKAYGTTKFTWFKYDRPAPIEDPNSVR